MTAPLPAESADDLLTSAEAARIAGVTARTVVRWHDGGLLAATRTLGGHRRFRRGDVLRALRIHDQRLTTEARTGTTEAGSLHR